MVRGDADFVIASKTGRDGLRTITTTHPSANSSVSGFGETFSPDISGYATRLGVMMIKSGTPEGELAADIQYTTNGTFAGAPNGTVLATSTNTISIADLAAGWTEEFVYFYFETNPLLEASEFYAFTVYINSSTKISSAHYIIYGVEDTVPAYEGGYLTYQSSAWACQSSGVDTVFFLYANVDNPSATPTPAPLPTGGLNVDTTDADVVMSALIDYGVPVVVMLLPVLFLWLIGGRGKWPFLMGIAIGTGMGYLFGLVPVWLVFIVSIVEVGMAYQSVRSG